MKFSKTLLFPILIILFVSPSFVQCGNILFYFSLTSYSHRIPVWPIVEELVKQGHEVTFISGYAARSAEINPKVIEISIKSLEEVMEQFGNILELRMSGNINDDWDAFHDFGILFCNLTMTSPEIQPLIKSEKKFDLIVLDAMYNECGLGFAYKSKAPVIIASTTSLFQWMPDNYGHSAGESHIPDFQYAYPPGDKMGFIQKVWNTLTPLMWTYRREYLFFPVIEEIMRKEMNIPQMPPISEMLRNNVSLVFVNSHFGFDFARSLPPLYVSISTIALHDKEKLQPLPKDLKKYMDESGPEGVVYISFGSVAKMEEMRVEMRNIFIDLARTFPKVRFIWKWGAEKPANFPTNIMTVGWTPQQSVLAHPKTKGFITHGGLGSLHEALYNEVPVIAFPIFGEQDFNARIVDHIGIGRSLEITKLEGPELKEALQFILTDKELRKQIKIRSTVFKDHPQKPLKTAMWWIDYVLKHKNTEFLKPLSMDQTWYERRLLDVYFFLFSIIWIAFAILWKIFKVFFLRQSRKTSLKIKTN